jgi:hypothetical protein
MRSLSIVILIGALAGIARSAELKRETIASWQRYISGADADMQARVNGRTSFLWLDQSEDRKQRVRRGEIVVAPVIGDGTQSVPDGLIHHWIGAVFIPHASIRTLLSVITDYGRYKEIYKPAVIESRVLGSSAGDQEFSMVWLRHVLFVRAAMQGHYRTHEFVVNARTGYSIADATSIQEIEDYGHSGAHLLPPDTGTGYIWRIHSVSRYEQHDDGLFLELEVIALSRDIPSSLRWLVTPVVNHVSINSLKTTLRQTRQAVQLQADVPERLAMRRRGQN